MATTDDLRRVYYATSLGLSIEEAAALTLDELQNLYYQNPPTGGGGGGPVNAADVGAGTFAGEAYVVQSAGSANLLRLDSNGPVSSSTSVGGALLVETTGSTGAGVIVYSNAGATATGRLVNIRADHVDFPQPALHVDYDGTANAVEIVSNSTDVSSNALSIVSNNPNDTTLGLSGKELGKGTIKVTHDGTGNDANASAISINLTGTGTAAQGIFLDAPTGTTGDLLKLRNSGANKFVVNKDGNITVGGGFVRTVNGTGPDSNGNVEVSGGGGGGSVAFVDLYLTSTLTNGAVNNAASTIPWTAEAEDALNTHSTVTNPSRVTIPSGLGGVWSINATVRFSASASGSYRNVGLYKNGVQVSDEAKAPSTEGDTVTVNSALLRLAEGDYLEVKVYQNSGSDRNIIGGVGTTTLRMARIGA